MFEVFGQPRKKKIAVETKDYNRALRKSEISEIIGDYVPATNTREIDEVWVLSQNGFSPDARDPLEKQPNFYRLSYIEFLRSLIDFPKYLQYLRMQIEQDGLLEYYVSQKFLPNIDAINYILKWVDEPTTNPLAILSTYGMGKTSLARKVAYAFAQAVPMAPNRRIPIYIPLNLLSSQQRIDGLLGSIFTSMVTLTGYTYPLFQKLNSLGHLVILLDGLDEMSHAMTWDDFRYNFFQISELITPNTKTIMFGRPNVFKDKNEYDEVVSAKSQMGKSTIKIARRGGCEVFEIAPFSTPQIHKYLKKYITFLIEHKSERKTARQIASRVSEITDLELDGLLARPVHAKMIAEIASDFDAPLNKFNRFELYKRFIDFVLARDYYERGGAAGVRPEARRIFLRRMAWRLRFELEKEAFRFGEISTAKHPLSESAARAMVAGAIIDSKYGDNFYFSHRSFQEYLTAEYLLHDEASLDDLGKRINLLSDEVIDFMADLMMLRFQNGC